MSKHEKCLYPHCNCISSGSVCKVAEAAEDCEKFCSFCGMTEREILRGYDCGYWDVCSKGDAEMIDPIALAQEKAKQGTKHDFRRN